MSNVEIRPFLPQHLSQIKNVITGYTTSEIFSVEKVEQASRVTISLRLEQLPAPKKVIYDYLDAAELARLEEMVALGISLGAFNGDELIGVALAKPEEWNRSLRLWEFHVAKPWRGQGIGRRLMNGMLETAVAQNLRVIVCETQSRNVPAIRAYRKLGFVLDGVDLSFYSNEDIQKEDVAIFMKRYL